VARFDRLLDRLLDRGRKVALAPCDEIRTTARVIGGVRWADSGAVTARVAAQRTAAGRREEKKCRILNTEY
jgi:hypothetical protein